MHFWSSRMRLALIILVAGILAASPALAEKPPWAGGKNGGGQKNNGSYEKQEGKGNGGHKGKSGGREDNDRGKAGERKEHRYFTEQHNSSIHDYFADEFRKGNCPPGLAKKRNGCLPPGQAKKWRLGRPLPRGVIFHDLPPSVVVVLGTPPAGHRFVRVAQDILLIAVGTGMVMDAIEDLSWEFNN